MSSDRERVFGVCPVHAPDRGECWDGCLPERAELEVVARAFRKFWLDRRRGVKPMRVAVRAA